MKSVLLIGLLVLCSFSNMASAISEGPDFQSLAREYLSNYKDLEIFEDLEGNFFLNLWRFTEGFLSAIGYETVVTSETDCNQNAHKLVSSFEAFADAFFAGEVIKAVRELKNAQQELNLTVSYCNQTFIEIGRFFQQVGYNWQQAVDTGFGLKRLILSTHIIKEDIKNGKTAWKNGDFYSAGSNFGNILSIFLYGKNTVEEEPTLKLEEPLVILQEPVAAAPKTEEPKKTLEHLNNSLFMDSIVDKLVQVPQGKSLIEGILNIASSYMGPALNVYDTDDLN